MQRFISPGNSRSSKILPCWIVVLSTLGLFLPTTIVDAQERLVAVTENTPGLPKSIDDYLATGQLSAGEKFARQKLNANPGDDQMRFGLGVIQFMQSIERLGQAMYAYQPQSTFANGLIPLMRLPVPENPAPEKVELKDLRDLVQAIANDLEEADKTLSKITSHDVKLPLHIFKFHFDFDKSGSVDSDESLMNIYRAYLGVSGPSSSRAELSKMKDIVVVFDRADVEWLRGYTCLIRSMCETFLAYDQQDFWDVGGHQLFDRGQIPHDWIIEERADDDQWWESILDLIAMIHNSNFKLIEPERMKTSHALMLRTIQHSREMWKRINAETDNHGEWIPNSKQRSVVSAIPITAEMSETWDEFLDEAEQILQGEVLIPFWRGNNPKRGINIKKVFHEPRNIDVVLWIHGSGAIHYIETGDHVTDPETWNRFQRVFRGNFVGFATWFN